MAKASRVAARTAKTMLSMEARMERLELMLEAMMTAKQRANLEALLAEDEPSVEVVVTVNGTETVLEGEGDVGSQEA